VSAGSQIRKKRDWGTTAVLVADLIATMMVATWGILYVKTDLKYLLIIAAITFSLALIVALLMRQGRAGTRPNA
jgi:Fe2+ transport system protein B